MQALTNNVFNARVIKGKSETQICEWIQFWNNENTKIKGHFCQLNVRNGNLGPKKNGGGGIIIFILQMKTLKD